MKVSVRCALYFVLLAAATLVPKGVEAHGLLQKQLQSSEPTAMSSLEGQACSDDEYKRYKTLVCGMIETCGCGAAECKLDWCLHEWVHKLKLEFGACSLKGC